MELFFSITTVIFSAIAIGVSIYTVNKQNKLSLFDKRYDVFHTANFLIVVTKTVINATDQPEKEILNACRKSYFEVNFLNIQNCDNNDLKSFYHNLCLSASKAECLFPKNHINTFNAFLNILINYFPNAIDGKNTDSNRKELISVLNRLEKEQIMEKLEKYIKIG